MAVKKRRFNWKARETSKIEIDNTSSNKIKLDLGDVRGNYDECNQLVLPSEKRPTKKKKESKQPAKILSKKQRKRLEKVVEKKKKKGVRANLLEALANVQAPEEELEKLTSVASVQTKGLKRHFQEIESGNFEEELTSKSQKVLGKCVRLVNQHWLVICEPKVFKKTAVIEATDMPTNTNEQSYTTWLNIMWTKLMGYHNRTLPLALSNSRKSHSTQLEEVKGKKGF